MSDAILPKPHIPPGLREAAERGTLVPFIGAGASRLAGCPGWNEFADGMLLQLVEQGKLTHAELAQIKVLPPRVKLSLVRTLADEHRVFIDYKKLFHPSGKPDHAKGQKLYTLLSKLAKTFVTTNYDEWLDTDWATPELADHEVNGLTPPTIPKPRKIFIMFISLSQLA
ncbi:MAG: hypothetical protein DRP28_06895 [Thermodesulfobacteriota bacterium]|nr:MAG: hypothetical protein DRP28_06895 [Thermodesulfobacteriota bacterium]RLB88171.1 MAG: hypothetical protein DRH50_15670 [Deltaproteobacteria bacterium]